MPQLAERPVVACAPVGADFRADIERAVAVAGGFGRVLAKSRRVLVKPNFNTGHPPPASSDPAFVKTVIQLLYEHGAAHVVLGECAMVGVSTRRTLESTGMMEAALQAGAEVVCFEDEPWTRVETGGRYLRRIRFARRALESQSIVYVPCLKTHSRADFTVSLKLAMGFVHPRDRIGLHLGRLRRKIVDLNLVVAPDLIILDGRRCFITGGPFSGAVREPSLVLASNDRIALDVEAARIIQSYPGNSLGRSPWRLGMIKRAAELRLGACSEEHYGVVRLTREEAS